MVKDLKLEAGCRVAVVGGGPSGSFFALYLLQYARKAGLDVKVHIYQERDFSRLGPRGCKGCAGILSGTLLQNIKELGLVIPEEVIQSRITCYRLYSANGVMEVCNPQPEQDILSVYRGGGPRLYAPAAPISFDDFLLKEAERRGATVFPQRVRRLLVYPRPTLEVGGRKEYYEAAVLAGGVNTLPVDIPDLDARPAATLQMVQDELHARREDIQAYLGTKVQVFFIPGANLVFGTLIPKGDFVNVSLLGKKGRLPSVEEFLSHPLVKLAMPFPYHRACGCRPRIAIRSAKGLYADRFVAVGDAQATRFYKDGIGSALLTAREAAHTMVHHGITREDFHRHYMPRCRQISLDNRAGQVLFALNEAVNHSASFFAAHSKLADEERAKPRSRRPFNMIIWGMFTGSYSYRHILMSAISPTFLGRLSWEVFREKVKRLTYREPKAEPSRDVGIPETPPHRGPGAARILVLGGGFAGVHTTLRLEKALRGQPDIDLTLVSNENFFLFTPLLHEVATGGVETRHIAYPYRKLRGDRRFNFLQREVRSVDLAAKKVVTDQETLPYDYLVLALGSVTDTTGLPALAKNVFTLKTLVDGIYLRNHIIEMFEQADTADEAEQKKMLTFVVVGGGYTGVQLVTEMRDFIVDSLIRHYPRVRRSIVRLILVQGQERILPDFDENLAAYALRQIKEEGIEVRLGSRVTRVWDDGLELNGTDSLSTCTVVWVAGISANPVVAALPVDKDASGRVKVDEHLEVPGFAGVYALGDNAHVKDKAGQPLPATAHVAVRQPAVAAANILADLRGRPKKVYSYSHMGQLVSLGSHSAVVKVYGFRVPGLLARVFWLVVYLNIMAGFYNRTRVALDWFLGLIFGRDITLLRLR